jgi:hypothetical protein
MPVDTMTPDETRVYARQIGGKTIEHDSPLWRTLCPFEQFRIDGRVPVAHSSKYLMESRMAPAKELVAVTFTPESEQALGVLQAISRFLKGKEYAVSYRRGAPCLTSSVQPARPDLSVGETREGMGFRALYSPAVEERAPPGVD